MSVKTKSFNDLKMQTLDELLADYAGEPRLKKVREHVFRVKYTNKVVHVSTEEFADWKKTRIP